MKWKLGAEQNDFYCPRGFFFRGQTQASESERKLIERPMNNIYLILNSLCVNFRFFFGIQIFPPIIFSLPEKKKKCERRRNYSFVQFFLCFFSAVFKVNLNVDCRLTDITGKSMTLWQSWESNDLKSRSNFAAGLIYLQIALSTCR